MAVTGKLTPLRVEKLRKPGRYGDGGNLWLQVSKWGTKSWLFRYTIDGKQRQMGLGSADTVKLGEAREQARQARNWFLHGHDPIAQRDAERAAARADAAKGVTFKNASERYIAAHEAAWKNEKHVTQWRATLTTYAYPIMGDLSVAAIDTGLVTKVLEPIWTTKPETASRLRGRIEVILDWAKVRGYRHGENPARWRGHLDKLLPAKGKVRKVTHHAALPIDNLASFMAALRKQPGVGARALEFAVLTAARTGEVIGARWSEIDLAAKMWTVPVDRMKAGREHRVPLSDCAVEILEALPRGQADDYVFPGAKPGAPLSNMSLLATLKRMGRGDLTTHGFRSTFRDWTAERTNYPREVAEMALAHKVADAVEAAYRRGDLFQKRQRLMQAWADACAAPPADKSSRVVSLREAMA